MKFQCVVLNVQCIQLNIQRNLMKIILDSSMVEHSAVNRGVVGSSPTRGVFSLVREILLKNLYGSMVKRLRHRPFTAVTGVQIPLESFFRRCGSIGRAADL